MERTTDRATILVVDDDLLHRELVRAALADMCAVVEADCADAALRAVQRHAVDLVVLDVVMPGDSGIEACRAIKALTNGRVPVLFVSALQDREHRLAGLSAGADDFLTKPFDRTELRLRVDMFLRLRAQARTIREQLDALQRLDALKDDLASLLIHDLKHPLAGVFAWLAIARSSAPPEIADDLDQALSAAARVRDAINDLLQIRAFEQGRLVPVSKDLALHELVADVVSTHQGVAQGREVTLAVQTTPTTFAGDAQLLRRALDNLLANAIKYAPVASTIDVVVRHDGADVVIEVCDRGPGVPVDRRADLFTKFGALDPASLRTRRGFGLGLYLVQLVAEAHGGRTGVRDRPQGGAIFEIVVPATSAAG
ncbi:MAG: hybrid sensor histidine kinase/response regulator [Deltaproteobacteria bacterium]|nr:hybrid sensor histidine kinase/response regulator [Deltaproteobacteria bacterium]